MEQDFSADAPADVPVVLLGASAGGLEAFTRFLDALGEGHGVAYVFLLHLDPRRSSNLPALLRSHTKLPLVEFQGATDIRPNHCYVPPPGAAVSIEAGRLRVASSAAPRGWGVDAALRSLAKACGPDAIAVILSGSSSDGAQGIRSVSGSGGLVIAQDEASATFPGMPMSAVATGLVDLVLPPEEIPGAIADFLVRRRSVDMDRDLPTQRIQEILAQVADDTGRDFRDYKEATLRRRVLRRMNVTGDRSPDAYLERLRRDPEESTRLLRDLLIGVTSFFRDGAAFQALAHALEGLVIDRETGDPIRIWVAGCSTGMEAYSLAILLTEMVGRTKAGAEIQIFATDIDEDALDTARRGEYMDDIEDDVSAEHLRRFFSRVDDGYRVSKSIRDLVIFSLHDVTSDPPFSRLDLVSCRNLLIYLEAPLQRQLISLFHYALKPGGVLFLGPAEGLAGESRLFDVVDAKAKVFRRRPGVVASSLRFPTGFRARAPGLAAGTASPRRAGIAEVGQQLLLESHAPPAVLVNHAREILCYFGRTAPYLEARSGVPDLDVLHMVRPELAIPLRAALTDASETHEPVVVSGVELYDTDSRERVDLTVRPVDHPAVQPGLNLVVFEPARPTPPAADVSNAKGTGAGDRMKRHLELELDDARRRLRSTVDALETANQELRSANEELLSMNEELQSSNEELETSKEELQSLNEELETVNEELEQRIEDAEAARGDLANLLRSSRIATVFLDRDLAVRSFTPAARTVFRLVETDVGRPISDVRCELLYETLEADARAVLEGLTPLEREMSSADGREFSVRVSPYRSEQDAIEGVVFVFIDITRLRDAEASERRLATVVADSNDAVAVVDLQGVVMEWNHGATSMYGYTAEEMIGRPFDLLLPEGSSGDSSALPERRATNRGPASLEGRRRRKDGTLLHVSSTETPLVDGTGQVYATATTERDISAQKRREDELEFLLRELDHRVRNSLAMILALVEQTASSTTSPQEYAAALKERISALLDIHDALAGGGWGEVDVVQMVRTALTPNAASEEQFDVPDESHCLPPQVATPVFMALHELAVNARKHGALSTPEGHVSVDVSVDRDGNAMEITWRETGGPPVQPPHRRGFGMTVIERGLEYEVGGEARLDFEESGLTAHLTVPLRAQDDGER